MGSWNGTCGLTNLPIISGEKVKVLIMSTGFSSGQVGGLSAFCYSNGILTPNFYAFDGQYNDYGSVENIVDDLNSQLTLKYFLEHYPKIKCDGVEQENYTLETLLDGLERASFDDGFQVFGEPGGNKRMLYNFLFTDLKKGSDKYKRLVKTFGYDPAKPIKEKWYDPMISFMMIRADIWDDLCQNYEGTFWKPQGYDGEIVDNYYCTPKNFYKFKFDKFIKRDTYNSIFDQVGESGFNLWNSNEWEAYAKTKDCDKEYLFKMYFENGMINAMFSRLRRAYLPVSGAGSQSAEWDAYQFLNKSIDKVCEEHLKEYEDDEDDE